MDPSWGLGTKVTRSVSNDREYSWYVDQMTTGRNDIKNCGPSVVAMASKWQDKNSTLKTRDIVDKYIPEGTSFAGVYQYTLYTWLKENNVIISSISEITEESLISELDKGNILIVGLDMKDIKYNPNTTQRVGEYFDFSMVYGKVSHYVIVKGYNEVDNTMYFETYDPFSASQTYSDGQIIGKDRYYASDEFIKAICEYKEYSSSYTDWTDVIVIKETK